MLTTSMSKKKIAPPPKMTGSERKKAQKQPEVHSRNRGFVETVFGSCCACDHDLNKRELKYYNKFTRTMIGDYDKDVPEHERSLQRLYTKVYGKEPNLSEKHADGRTMIDDKWKDIGF